MQKTLYLFTLIIFTIGCSTNENNLIDIEKKTKQKRDKYTYTIDSIINLAKDIDNNQNLLCKIMSPDSIAPFTVCYDKEKLVKITETRFPFQNYIDSSYKSKIVPLKNIYFINEEYVLIIHPKFEVANDYHDKWDWYKIVLKNNKIIHYSSIKYNNNVGFVKETTGQYKSAKKFYPIYINQLKQKYKTTNKT